MHHSICYDSFINDVKQNYMWGMKHVINTINDIKCLFISHLSHDLWMADKIHLYAIYMCTLIKSKQWLAETILRSLLARWSGKSCMVVWCTQNLHWECSSFMRHQPHNNKIVTTLVDIQNTLCKATQSLIRNCTWLECSGSVQKQRTVL